MILRDHLKSFPVKTETTYGTNPVMPNPLDSLPWITDRPPTESDACDGDVQVLFVKHNGKTFVNTYGWKSVSIGTGIHGWLHCPGWQPLAPVPRPSQQSETLIAVLAAIGVSLNEAQADAIRDSIGRWGLQFHAADLAETRRDEILGNAKPVESKIFSFRDPETAALENLGWIYRYIGTPMPAEAQNRFEIIRNAIKTLKNRYDEATEESSSPKANALAAAIRSAIAEGILAAKRPGGLL